MPRPCQVCSHPERERIDVDLALEPNAAIVARRYGLHERAMRRHLANHVAQADIARYRSISPTAAQVSIQDLASQGGEAAVIGFSRLIQECKACAEKCDNAGAHDTAVKYRKVQLDAYKEQAKIAAIYPGRKTVTNNNLVLGDVGHVFGLIDSVLRPFPEARQAVALAFAQQTALEHQA